MLSNKSTSSKMRWLIAGVITGIFLTATIPQLFFPRILTEEEKSLLQIRFFQKFTEYSQWPPFLTDPTFDINSWRKHCWNNQAVLPISNSDTFLKKNAMSHGICKEMMNLINSIYTIKSEYAKVNYPSSFAEKIRKIFNNNEKLYSKALEQELYFALNKYTFENTVYNPLRGRRPVQPPEVPVEQYLNQTMESTSKSCDLCNYQNMTAIDPLGRMENRHAYSAANAFKFDQWHSMFMPRQHDITKITFEQLKDVYTLAWKWIRAVHKQSPKHRFPTLLWDSLPHGGASQVHPHIHATVHSDNYYGQFESIRYSSERYYRDYENVKNHRQKNFFRAIQDIHIALNLTVSLNGLTVIVPITSRKEYDLIVLAENFDERVIRVIYQILQGYFKKLKQFSFSSCLYLPPLSANDGDRGLAPVYFRIIPRGQVSSLLSEVSSLDLLSIYNVNKLPAELYAEIQSWFSS